MKRFASAALLLGVAVVLYRKAIRLWWTYDDPLHLRLVLTHGWSDLVAMPRPFLLASQTLLLRTFGTEAAMWYAAQIALIVIATIALFFLLDRFCDLLTSLAAATMFVAGPPLCGIATELRTMHAIEALALATLSVALYVFAFRRRSILFEMCSAIVYFVSMTANAMTIGLPLLLVTIPLGTMKVRARHLLFHAVALIVFVAWARPPLAFTSRDAIVNLAGEGLAGIFLLAVLAIGIVRAWRTRSGMAVGLCAIGAMVAALLVSEEGVVMVWIVLIALFAFGASMFSISPRIALLISAVAVTFVANRQEWAGDYTRAKQMSDEARAFMTMDGASLIRRPTVPASTLGELRWLKEVHERRSIGSGWFYDDIYLCTHNLRGRHFYEYHEGMKQLVEVTARIPDLASAYCGSWRDDVPLRAEFHQRNGTLLWRLGPYNTGRYSIIFNNGTDVLEAERDDSAPLLNPSEVTLRIRYDSPEGWKTYSPEIVLDFPKQSDFTWHR